MDRLALWLLAKALTDPEDVLTLADAAEQRHAELRTDGNLADAELAAYSQHLAKLDAAADSVRTALRALANVPGVEAQVTDLRAKLDHLAHDRDAVVADHARLLPQRDHTRDRQEFLRRLFMEGDVLINFETGEVSEEGEPYLHLGSTVSLAQAAALLRTTEDALTRAHVPTIPLWDEEDDLVGVYVETRYVVYQLLSRAGREEVRRILRNLEATVTLSRPLDQPHRTPLPERVRLVTMGRTIRTDAANLYTSA